MMRETNHSNIINKYKRTVLLKYLKIYINTAINTDYENYFALPK